MKKIIMTAVVTFIMVFCMTGCGEEQDEFVDYINGGIKTELGKLESQAKDSYASVTGDNAKDNETTLKERNTNTITLTKQGGLSHCTKCGSPPVFINVQAGHTASARTACVLQQGLFCPCRCSPPPAGPCSPSSDPVRLSPHQR